ncbi:uncharacterized protein LOC103309892 [Acyrthosiphon pisum]|uniref:THAP-type domain-containing protein n=1 Tax=Acyrthosiphon pisum TaxID=7029 RepID=A0A8R2F9F3_ACYPI|nr:uncharacterized protein LOC103309892 [Acyrthosiphon pisum]|eukprot:XP_008184786.1 PREDICTED: uncharacterized protein LOC103309892 [Acyrthosiphon pisum]
MVQCWVPLCSHISNRETCKFFRFPANYVECKVLAKSVRRADTYPTKNNKICSCHFKDGLRENGPTQFEWNKNSSFSFTSPEKYTKRKKVDGASCSQENESSIIIENSTTTETYVLTPTNSKSDEVEKYFLHKEIEELKKEKLFLKNNPFGYHSIESDNKLFEFYCGINQILMTLIKLRLNLAYPDLAFRFKTSETTYLHRIRTKIACQNVSIIFKIVETLDCTEISCDIPKSLLDQKLTYSSYKNKNTLKGLIGVAPNGVITYASKLYPGSTSDKKIVGHCGVLNILEPGDLVLADKGFLISDLMPPETSLNIPPFLMSPQFTPSEVLKT